MEKKSPIEEAQCYVDNAKQTLIDNGEYDSDLKRYGDRKYVKSAVSIQLGSHRAEIEDSTKLKLIADSWKPNLEIRNH